MTTHNAFMVINKNKLTRNPGGASNGSSPVYDGPYVQAGGYQVGTPAQATLYWSYDGAARAMKRIDIGPRGRVSAGFSGSYPNQNIFTTSNLHLLNPKNLLFL